MTAVAGILNKQGVAIAADSAVTISGYQGRKVYNSANKIFTLSKYHPVGIAIYNSAQFMGIPWEILIKDYRKQLGKTHFKTLAEYKTNFFDWLREHNYFTGDDNAQFVYSDVVSFLEAILSKLKNTVSLTEQDLKDALSAYVKNTNSDCVKIDSLKKLNKEKYIAFIKPTIMEVIGLLEQKLKLNLQKGDFESHLTDAYYTYLIHDQFLQYTGLIFTGYGESELFPRMYPVNVSIIIDDLLRFNDDSTNSAEVSNRFNSFIRPFAQTDVINTILQGISPELNTLSTNVFGDFITKFLGELKSIPGMPISVQKGIDTLNIDNYIAEYQKTFNNIIDERYVHPLMGAVAQLSKEDLAEMAESLVYLTYLKRRFTMAEESVGGPVDIAVITKGDGFIWIKRKHYFDPELNCSYFNKYL